MMAQRRSENLAAVVNALLVLLVPAVIMAVASGTDASVTVRPSEWSRVLLVIEDLIAFATIVGPFAMFAGWRTWVHARRRLGGCDPAWQGSAEAGACGVGIAIVFLLPGLMMRPADATPYIVVYCGGALLVGLGCGLVLRMTALWVLRHAESTFE